MKNIRTLAVAVALILASAAAAQAQQEAAAGTVADPLSSNCTYNFGSGAFVWCVSENGNVMRLTSPAGFEHIRIGLFAEGYVVCAAGVGPYYDQADGGASGWGAPVLVAGPSGTSVTIRRTTTDGRFTLLSQIKGDKAERDLTLVETLTNNGGAIGGVQLLRSADFDIDNNTFNFFDRGAEGTWARNVRGVTESAITLTVAHATGVSTSLGPVNCAPPAATTPGSSDSSSWVRYDIGGLNAGAKKVVKFVYRVQ